MVGREDLQSDLRWKAKGREREEREDSVWKDIDYRLNPRSNLGSKGRTDARRKGDGSRMVVPRDPRKRKLQLAMPVLCQIPNEVETRDEIRLRGVLKHLIRDGIESTSMPLTREKMSYVKETSEDKENIRGWLSFWAFSTGIVRYTDLVQYAKENGWERKDIPQMRKTSTAFVKAKDSLRDFSDSDVITDLEELEGWDGRVIQKLKVDSLKINEEYRVAIRREGRMRGKYHMEDVDVLRLKYSPPDDFDVRQWRLNYMDRVWRDDGENESIQNDLKESMRRLREVVSVEGYWDETEVDPILANSIRGLVVQRFLESATCVDDRILKNLVEKQIQEMQGIRYKNRKSMYFVPAFVNNGNEDDETENRTFPRLERLEGLVKFFNRANRRRRESLYSAGGTRISQPRKMTQFDFLQFIDNKRMLDNLQDSVNEHVAHELANHYDSLRKAVENWDGTNIEAFMHQLRNIEVGAVQWCDRINDVYGVSVEVDVSDFSEITQPINDRVNEIDQEDHEVVFSTIQGLMNISDRLNT